MTTQWDTAGILGPQGRIAARLRQYEDRPQQLEMAAAVAQAIAAKEHLIVEAGTGTGKSFAYLVPAILAATESQQEQPEIAEDDERRQRTRVVISTHTISLQEQLISRDIPFLNSVIPLEFSAVLVKGRGNYLSLRRLQGSLERAATTFSQEQELQQLGQIANWSTETADGSLASLNFKPLPDVWDEVRSDHGNCLGRKCPTYDDCYYFRARRRAWNADLLVVNHALFFSDLALRREGASILPDYDVVVFDEAHTLEAVAADHLGLSASNGQVEFLLNKLYNERTNKGLLVHHQHVEGQKLVQHLRYLAQDFFDDVRRWQADRSAANGRLRSPPQIAVDVRTPLVGLADSLAQLADGLEAEAERIEVTAQADRARGLAQTLDSWLAQSIPSAVYWTEITGRKQDRIQLLSAPVDVAQTLREELFQKVNSVILTSATLAVGSDDFQFIRNRLGLTKARELKLGSPFDYRRHVKLILPGQMPDPSADPAGYEMACCEKIQKYVSQTEGRAFVLFTSYRMLDYCARRLATWFTANNLQLYSQSAGLPRTLMLEKFRTDPRGVLFGADSFWQGVDVPGNALQNVIITKLPFSVPDHPLLEARLELIKERGGVPFKEYQIPEAVIKLKQGFGRLIRTRTDHGQVAILDPRIRTKSYGRQFLKSLPDCDLVYDD